MTQRHEWMDIRQMSDADQKTTVSGGVPWWVKMIARIDRYLDRWGWSLELIRQQIDSTRIAIVLAPLVLCLVVFCSTHFDVPDQSNAVVGKVQAEAEPVQLPSDAFTDNGAINRVLAKLVRVKRVDLTYQKEEYRPGLIVNPDYILTPAFAYQDRSYQFSASGESFENVDLQIRTSGTVDLFLQNSDWKINSTTEISIPGDFYANRPLLVISTNSNSLVTTIVSHDDYYLASRTSAYIEADNSDVHLSNALVFNSDYELIGVTGPMELTIFAYGTRVGLKIQRVREIVEFF